MQLLETVQKVKILQSLILKMYSQKYIATCLSAFSLNVEVENQKCVHQYELKHALQCEPKNALQYELKQVSLQLSYRLHAVIV